jgi:hypothetical protein
MTERTHTIDAVHNAACRTSLLYILGGEYPEWVQETVLRKCLSEKDGNEMSTDYFLALIEYLAEKTLIRIERKKAAKIRIPPRGIDFLEGSIQEAGLMRPEML